MSQTTISSCNQERARTFSNAHEQEPVLPVWRECGTGIAASDVVQECWHAEQLVRHCSTVPYLYAVPAQMRGRQSDGCTTVLVS